LSIEAARSEKSRIEHVNAIGRGQDYNVRFSRVETVHFDKQLIKGVLLLAVASKVATASLAAL
jgi:hypothetical protein